MNKKIIVADLDGTLLNSEHQISENNKKAIYKFEKLGNYFVINTGRPYYRTKFLLESFNHLKENDYCICFNGGLILNGKEEVIFSYTLEDKDVKDIIDLADKINCAVLIYDINHIEYDYLTPSTLFLEKLDCTILNEKGKSDLKNKKNIYKILYIGELVDIERIKKEIPKEFYEKYNIVQSGPLWIEIMPKIIDKGFGLKKICELLAIDLNNSYAIGDEENDIAMLKMSKVGVCPASARKEIKKEADLIVSSNDEDAVKELIDLILEGKI